jgi:epoxyqueuosine reductase
VTSEHNLSNSVLTQIKQQIIADGQALGFQDIGVCDIDLSQEEPRLQAWLDNHYHGEMDYMAKHGMLRARPAELHPGTLRVISVRMDYLPEDAQFAQDLANPDIAYISRYALGRDYHKLLRNRLKKLGQQIEKSLELTLGYRPFVDSAPILERPLAQKAGLGWVGKHSLLLNQDAGSWFFLGELLIDLPLPVDQPNTDDCGNCVACITMCPTQAIVAPYVVDGRRCISYLTIELQDAIPVEFRQAIGNRIYGCDDCQLVCPWNRYAQLSAEKDFQKRPQIANKSLLELWQWDEQTFLNNTEGSPIRRIGYQRWLRNLAIGLGNAPYQTEIIQQLSTSKENVSPMAQEHIDWALEQQMSKQTIHQETEKKQQRLIRIVQKGLPGDA